MLGRTHALIGVATLATAHVASGGHLIQPHLIQNLPIGVALGVGAAIFGALTPDIDANQSTIKVSLGTLGKLVGFGMKLSGVKHRGLTHYGISAFVVMIVSVLSGWLFGYWDAGTAFGLGYLSHILSDGMTKSGVPLLWPVKKNVHLLPRGFRIKTGSPAERLVFVFTFVFLICLIVPPDLAILLARGAIKTVYQLQAFLEGV